MAWWLLVEKDMRPRAHEIDTQARRIVPLAFPQRWEHRESTGRDYGIDMSVEIFDGNDPVDVPEYEM
jgi:hypothetical protein